MTLVKGDPRCMGGGATPFPGLFHFTLIMLSVKQGGIKYYFLVFGMAWPRIEPQSAITKLTVEYIIPQF